MVFFFHKPALRPEDSTCVPLRDDRFRLVDEERGY